MQHVRKLVKAGLASHTIALPKAWLDKNKLKKGDMLYVLEKSDKELLIRTQEQQDLSTQGEAEISVDGKDLDMIQREITSAYINNYSTINLSGATLPQKARNIRDMLQSFVALEITEQTQKKLVAKDLLNLKEISVDKTIRRMDMVLRSIMQDAIGSIDHDLEESIQLRDEDINRLYFLLVRLLKQGLRQQTMAEYLGLQAEQIPGIWQLSVCIENIADHCETLSRLFPQLSNAEERKGLKAIYKSIQKLYTDAITSYYEKNRQTAHQVLSDRTVLEPQWDDFLSAHQHHVVAQIVKTFEYMTSLTTTIARVVLDS